MLGLTQSSFEEVSLLERCWDELTRGIAHITRVFNTERHHYLVLRRGVQTLPPRPADIDLLERVLLGQAQKNVAFDSHCSPSRVATGAARCLKRFGLDCGASETPAMIVMMVHARHRGLALDGVECEPLDPSTIVLKAERIDRNLSGLSCCERSVLGSMVDGLSHAEIALNRGVSERTIANQVGSAYSKLGISGRISLLCSLIESGGSAVRSLTTSPVVRHGSRETRAFPVTVRIGPPPAHCNQDSFGCLSRIASLNASLTGTERRASGFFAPMIVGTSSDGSGRQ